jgi:hypothetical protein
MKITYGGVIPKIKIGSTSCVAMIDDGDVSRWALRTTAKSEILKASSRRCKGVMEISSLTWSSLIVLGDVIVAFFIS